MRSWRYRGRNNRGEAVEGVMEADSADGVAARLQGSGIIPVHIDAAPEDDRGGTPLDMRRFFRRRPGTDALVLFTQQMHALTRSGVPLVQGLRGLAASSFHPRLAQVLGEMVESLEAGRGLSDAMAPHGDVFPAIYVSLVRVGETSGNLEEAFGRLHQYLQFERETRRKIKSAVRYPAIVFAFIGVAIAVISIWVIPAFSRVLSSFDADLPWATKIIIGTSDLIATHWLPGLVLLALAYFGFRFWRSREPGRTRWDRAKLRFPVVGPIIEQATLARFCRAFSTTYRSGVPLGEALGLIARAVDNAWISARVLEMRQGIERGDSLHRSATRTGVFTPLVLQMLQVGEESGRVDQMIDEAANYYEGEVSYRVENLSASIEPILTVGIGVMVLILALGVFLPMWGLSSAAF